VDDSGNVWQLSIYNRQDKSFAAYDQAIKRSQHPANLNVRVFDGATPAFDGFTLVLEKWDDKLSLIAANANPSLNLTPLVRYEPFLQLEATNVLFNNQFVTKTCPGKERYNVKQPKLPVNIEQTCRSPETVTGITLASIRPSENVFSIQAMVYGLRSRFEHGNREYKIFFGGANSGNGLDNNGFDGAFGSDQKIFVIEKWADQNELQAHMDTSTVDYIKDASGLISQPTSIYMKAVWQEVHPKGSPEC
jgi:quinol monooxygenase YgiN